MTELPERIWVTPDIYATHGEFGRYGVSAVYKGDKKFLRADTAIPRSQADAMVAAAVDACAEVLEECGIDGSAFAQTFDEYRRGRAAFDRAVREAVEKERERCARIAASFTPDDEWDRGGLIAAAIRAPQEPSE